MSLLTVEALNTRFATERGLVHAVEDVSFALQAGESLGIVGESGSGKSVLCRTVMRLTEATSGRVEFDGTDLLALPRTKMRALRGAEIAMVLQNPMTALNPVVRIGRQVTETLRAHRPLSREQAKARALELLAEVGIPSPARRFRSYPHELSGGMRQRVCIAVAVACTPRLLFADEPTTALDVTVQRQILDLLDTLRTRHGMATVLVSHDLNVVHGRTDRVLVMYGGRVLESGPTKEVFATPRHPYTAALLASVPKLAAPGHTRLEGIPGRPVDVVDPVPGCRFAARCRFARARCHQEDPVMTDDTHAVACFFPVDGTSA